ncbi:MAG: PEP-CTERM sorting domain-containing protein [Planctomycetota bacterium]
MSKVFVTAATVIGLAASASQASVIQYTGLGFNSQVQVVHNGTTLNVHAGQINIKIDSTPFVAFCVDMDHSIKSDWLAGSDPVASITGGVAAAYLYDTFKAGVTDNIKGAALQIAIWEVVDDFGGSLSLANGDFKFSTAGDILNQANAYLAAIPGNLAGYITNSYVLKSGWDPRSQNLIVPEPGTLIALMLGLPLFVMRRRLA